MPTEKKMRTVEELKTEISEAELVVLTDYRGLTVSDLQELRASLRPVGGRFRIAKNSLTRIAANESGVDGVEGVFEGPLALGYAQEDIVGVAKAITDFAKSSRVLTVKGGILEKQFVAPEEITKLSSLPSKETLQGKLVGLMQSPLSGTLAVLSGPSRSLAYVLQARADQLGQGEEAAAD